MSDSQKSRKPLVSVIVITHEKYQHLLPEALNSLPVSRNLQIVTGKPTDTGYVLQFMMEDYGTFVDKGVKGTGGTLKGKSWSGRRWYIDYRGKRRDSPYKYGRGTGKKGGLTKGIGSFIRKKTYSQDRS